MDRDAESAAAVAAVNHKPKTVDDTVTVVADGRNGLGALLANDSDPDGDPLAVVGVQRGATVGTVGDMLDGTYGSLTVQADGTYVYDVDESRDAVRKLGDGATAVERFGVEVGDGRGGVAKETLTVTVVGVNDAPVASDDTRTIREDALSVSGKVLVNDKDIDRGDSLSVSSVDGAVAPGEAATGRFGTLVLNADGSYVYTLDNTLHAVQALGVGETATERFTYEVVDLAGAHASATLTVTITGRNDPLVATPDTADAVRGASTTGNVLGNDTDIDGDTLSVTAAAAKGGALATPGTTLTGKYGTLVVQEDGSYVYAVDAVNAKVAALTGTATLADNFSVQVSDGTVTRTSTLKLTVHAGSVPPPPVAAEDDVPVWGLTPADGNVLANDQNVTSVTEVNFSPGLVGIPVSGQLGTLVVSADGRLSYTPDERAAHLLPGDIQIDEFTYTARGPGGASQAFLRFEVHGENEAPALDSIPELRIAQGDGPARGTIGYTDPDAGDGHALTVRNIGPTYGLPWIVLHQATTDDPYHGTLEWEYVVPEGIAFLAEGEELSERVGVQVRDSAGNVSAEQIFVTTLVGRNDAPTFAYEPGMPIVAEWANGSPQEVADETHVSAANFFFDDIDLTDVHAVSVVAREAGYLGEFTVALVDEANHVGLARFEIDDSAIDGLREGETLIQSYDLTVADNHGGSVSQTVTVEIVGSSDAEPPEPAFFIGYEDEILEGNVLADNPFATELVSVTPLHEDPVPVGTPMELDIGRLTFAADGSFVLEPNAAANGNRANGAADIDFSYIATGPDGPVGGSFNILMEGANDAPFVETADDAATVSAGGASTAAGLVAFDDPDWGDGHLTYVVPAAGGYLGEFSATVTEEPVPRIGGGRIGWHFSIDPDALAALVPGEVVTQTYTIVIRDAEYATAEQQVILTLEGPPVAGVTARDDTVLSGVALGSAIAIPEWALLVNDTSTAGPVEEITGVRDATGGSLGAFTPSVATDDAVGFTLTAVSGGGFVYEAAADGGSGSAHVAVARAASGNGTVGADTLVGGSGKDRLDGGDGDDIVIGGDGADLLYGSVGNDRIDGGGGDDAITDWYGTRAIIDAGDGDDVVNIVADGTMRGDVDGGAGRDTVVVNGADVTALDLRDIEILQTGNVRITGTVAQFEAFEAIWRGSDLAGSSISLLLADAGEFDLGNRVVGGGADTTVVRNATVAASDGGNIIHGGAGNDALTGGSGSDVLGGNGGIDTLTGRGGSDVFVFSAPVDGVDTIVDMVHLTDRIALGAAGFGGGLAPGTTVHLAAASTPVAATAGAGWLLYDTDDGRLSWDADGSGSAAAVQFASLYGAPTLSEADFIVRDDPFVG